MGGNCCFISDVGFIDFAGSAVVHMLGGVGAITGAIIIGPRLGRFDEDAPKPKAHNWVFSALGAFILWFGWYGFNSGSTFGASGALSVLGNKISVNTTLAGSSACLVGLILNWILTGFANLEYTLNCFLIGLVAITAPCAVVDPWAAIVIGAIAALLYFAGDKLTLLLKIDDPLNAGTVHFLGGLWGALSVGVFATKEAVTFVYQRDGLNYGFIMGGGGAQIAVQIVGCIVIMFWSALFSSVIWLSLRFAGILRVSESSERSGLDIYLHGTHAYADLAVMSKAIAQILGDSPDKRATISHSTKESEPREPL